MTLIGLAACTSSTPEENPYSEEISQAFDAATSDYIREILSDGQITAAEVRDSQEHNIACLSDAGISAQYVDDGQGYKSLSMVDVNDDMRAVERSCYEKWVGDVGPLSEDQITNPNNQDFDALIAACLVSRDLAPEGFTGSDFRELRKQSSTQVTTSPGESVSMPQTDPIILPGGVSMDNPQAVMCLTNPSL